MTGWGIAAAAAGIGGYAAARYFSGEDPAATLWDEASLRRQSLEILDKRCSSNPVGSGLVVTLSTIPSRIGAIGPALKSLLRQSARPREIRLCLPEWSRREHCAYAVPDWLERLANVRIVRCPDEGPATKFLRTLQDCSPGQGVVVVDDDRIYHPRLLEIFARLGCAYPDEAIGASGWRAPADRVDRPTTLWRRLRGAPYVPLRAHQVRRPQPVDIVQGLHGYLVRPRFFDLAALGDLEGAPAPMRFVDDVWLSGHCRAPRIVRPMALAFTDYAPREFRSLFRATSLGLNHNRAPRDEGRNNSIALRYFSGRWMISAIPAPTEEC